MPSQCLRSAISSVVSCKLLVLIKSRDEKSLEVGQTLYPLNCKQDSQAVKKDSTPATSTSKGLGPEDFIKLRLLGKGDVGRVYLVRKKDTDELYAMKVLKKEDMIKRNKVCSSSHSRI